MSWNVIEGATRTSLVRFSTAGSVDDGKSTLIGRLLHDTSNVYDDHLDALRRKSELSGDGKHLSLALLTDGLKAEQEQGITIDVAYRYFSTSKRWFILADTPGHEQYTRNMATGASTADLTIVLIDAQKGVITQTKRHAFIAALLGVPRLLVAINKMDLVNYDEQVFESIKADFEDFSTRLGIRELRFVPIAALPGDNVVQKSNRMSWYHGETVMEYLENVYIAGDRNQVDFRFPVQNVFRPNASYRGYAGQISSGHARPGDEVIALPSMRKSRIKSIDVSTYDGATRELKTQSLPYATAPQSVVLTLEDEIDISRGDMVVRSQNVPAPKSQFEAMLIWMSEAPLQPQKPYRLLHTSRDSKVFIRNISYRIDVNSLSRIAAQSLELNEIGRVSFTSTKPLFLDSYQHNRATGNFILVDSETNHTVAAGLVLDRNSLETFSRETSKDEIVSKEIHAEDSFVTEKERRERAGFKAVTLWCTGLSGSGKSSLAKAVERRMFDLGKAVYRLDGDNLRSGINRDLGFSEKDRSENIRRAAEVSKLMNEAGVSVICSLISPREQDREQAKAIIGADRFIEVFLSAPLEVCEARDPHGLYKKARAGEIGEFTGISAAYEVPKNPNIIVDSSRLNIDQSVEVILKHLQLTK